MAPLIKHYTIDKYAVTQTFIAIPKCIYAANYISKLFFHSINNPHLKEDETNH